MWLTPGKRGRSQLARERTSEEFDCVAMRLRGGFGVVAHDDLSSFAPISERISDFDIDARHVEAVMRLRRNPGSDACAIRGLETRDEFRTCFGVVVVLIECACHEKYRGVH